MSYRLLIVPGENQTLRSLPGALADDVETAILETANDALWEVRVAPPEAVVADVDLPGMSGLDMAEVLSHFGVHTRLVLWSREHNTRHARLAAQQGVFRYLQGQLPDEEVRTAMLEAVGHPSVGGTRPQPVVAEPPVEPPAPELAREAPPEPASTREPPRQAPAPRAEPPAREPPAREPAPAGRMAGRVAAAAARAAAEGRATREPGEEQASLRPGTRRKDGALVLTPENYTPIRNLLTDLGHDLGTQCIMLTDRAGMTLVEVGDPSNLPMVIVLPLLSTSFSTAGEVARQLHEAESTNLYMHEGNNYDLYCFDVMQRFLLVLVFNKKTSVSKMGIVWGTTRRAIRELQEALS